MEKLGPLLEAAIRDSPEARKALRAWLNDLDRKYPLPKPAPPPSIPTAQPAVHVCYGEEAWYNVDPVEYRWICIGGHSGSRVVKYERELPRAGLVQLNYYYTTGVFQLQYKNPDYDEDYPYGEPRRLQETYRDLTKEEFIKMLRNPPTFFRKGYLAR